MIDRILRSLILSLLVVGHSACGSPDETLWRLTFNSNWLGPVEAHFDVTLDGDTLVAVSRSGGVSLLQSISGDHDLSDGLVAFTAEQGEAGTFHGSFSAPWKDDLDFLFGFHWLWSNDPFSHCQLKRSAQSAEELFAFFDNYRVGFEAASVNFDGDVAILKVATMMGADTIEQIEAAYDEIAAAGPRTLIIDLRGNGGGAFAV